MSGALEAVDRILNRGGEPEEVLAGVLAALVDRGAAAWAGVAFVEGGRPVLGPSRGRARPDEPETRAVDLGGARIAELWASPGGDAAVLDRVAVLISPYCVRQDETGGV